MSDSWTFAANFDPHRRSRLESIESYEAVVEAVGREISAISSTIAPGHDSGLTECLRVEFTFGVSPHTFDAFFNSPVGYRAQYLKDPNMGNYRNHLMVDELSAKLLEEDSIPHGPHEMNSLTIKTSLEAASAKVWIEESSFPLMILLVISPSIYGSQLRLSGRRKLVGGFAPRSEACFR